MKGTRKKYDAKFKEFIDNSAVAFEAPKVDNVAIEKEKDRYLRVIGDLPSDAECLQSGYPDNWG